MAILCILYCFVPLYLDESNLYFFPDSAVFVLEFALGYHYSRLPLEGVRRLDPHMDKDN